jgi:hypothetical protein
MTKIIVGAYIAAWIVFIAVAGLMISDTIAHKQPNIMNDWIAYQRNQKSAVGSAPLHPVDRPRP